MPDELKGAAKIAGTVEKLLFGALVVLMLSAPFSIAISQSALALAILAGVVLLALGRRPPQTGVALFMLTFVLWAMICIPFSGEPTESLRHAKRFLLLPAFWLFAAITGDETRKAKLLGALCLGAAGVAVFGIIDYGLGPGGLDGRAMLTQGYMTAGGLMMLTGLVITAFLLTARSWSMRVALAIVLLPVLTALVLTYTRNAWFGYAAGVTLMLILARPRWTPVFVVLIVIAGFAAPGELRSRLLSSFDPGHVNNEQRVIMWRTGWWMLRDHPITGVGDRNLKGIYRSYHVGEHVEIGGHLHSNYAMIAAIWGWPGLILALAFLASIFVALVKRWRGYGPAQRAPPLSFGWTLAALGCLLGFMVGGLFEWNFGDAEIALLIWSVAGLGLARNNEEEAPA